ncbi:MAG: hypothetical protein ABGY11_12540 [Candidatus Thioglobus sp.]|jgi:hypothetical protein
MEILKTPPYGKKLKYLIATGNKFVFIPICVGASGWERAKFWQGCNDMYPLVLPLEGEPSDYSWSVVNDCCVLIDDSDGSPDVMVCELVSMLLRSGSKTITLHRPWSVNSVTQYRPEVSYVE